jgi:hypothetical protein
MVDVINNSRQECEGSIPKVWEYLQHQIINDWLISVEDKVAAAATTEHKSLFFSV